MFFLAVFGTALAAGMAINAADKAADGGLIMLKVARGDGALEGIERYKEGPGKEARKDAYEQGYKDCSEDMRGILAG